MASFVISSLEIAGGLACLIGGGELLVRGASALAAAVRMSPLVIGLTAAWLVTMTEFPGRRLLEVTLVLPFAFPAYVLAYAYTHLLDHPGPVQTLLREVTGWGPRDYWFPEIRSLGRAIAMLSLVLYPYVYLLARAAFLDQSVAPLEVGRTLGAGRWRSFFTIALPLARPAVIAGVSLALMETLADYGTVQYFGVSTFTTGIFRTWFGLGDGAAAAQLSAVLMSFVLVLILIELWSRRRARFHQTGTGSQRSSRVVLVGVHRWSAFLACFLPLMLGFLLPAGQLAVWAVAAAPAAAVWAAAWDHSDPAVFTNRRS